jgi:hypothetical protein
MLPASPHVVVVETYLTDSRCFVKHHLARLLLVNTGRGRPLRGRPRSRAGPVALTLVRPFRTVPWRRPDATGELVTEVTIVIVLRPAGRRPSNGRFG